MLVLLPFMLLPVIINPKWSWMTLKVIKLWASIFSALTFVRFKVHSRNIPQKNRAYVYVCNHNSYLDGVAVPLAIPGEFKPLGKKELLDIPIFGWILKSIAVLVDRTSVESRKESIERLTKSFKRGTSILIFPEGTTNKTDQPLTPFYDGAFRLAIENRAPILPMVILNSKKLMPRNGFSNRPGTVDVHFLEPLETTGMTLEDMPALKLKVYHLMEDAILKYG